MALVDDAKLDELRRLCGPEVDSQLRSGGEWGLDDATLRRWIVARKGDVKAAARDLRAHAEWRAAFVPRGHIFEEEIQDDLDQNKAFLPGFDKQGRPLCIVLVARHHILNAEMSKRYIAYSLDTAALFGSKTPGWDGKISGIFDLRGLKSSNCDFSTLRNVFDLLQNHYPERLHKLWLFCAPVVFYGLWKLVYPFIDPVTRQKVAFVFEKDVAKFESEFGTEVLPQEIYPKGTGRLIRIDERRRMLMSEAGQVGKQAQEDAGVGLRDTASEVVEKVMMPMATQPVEVVA